MKNNLHAYKENKKYGIVVNKLDFSQPIHFSIITLPVALTDILYLDLINSKATINGIKPQGKPWTLFSGASPGELNHTFSSAEA